MYFELGSVEHHLTPQYTCVEHCGINLIGHFWPESGTVRADHTPLATQQLNSGIGTSNHCALTR
jgi:hypothetical protein